MQEVTRVGMVQWVGMPPASAATAILPALRMSTRSGRVSSYLSSQAQPVAACTRAEVSSES